jgi:hypothetical protein
LRRLAVTDEHVHQFDKSGAVALEENRWLNFGGERLRRPPPCGIVLQRDRNVSNLGTPAGRVAGNRGQHERIGFLAKQIHKLKRDRSLGEDGQKPVRRVVAGVVQDRMLKEPAAMPIYAHFEKRQPGSLRQQRQPRGVQA